MLDRQKLAGTIKEATDKAGTLVTAALVIASCALVVALVALLIAGKARNSNAS